ncbi:3(4)-beta-glucanase AFUA_2G14360 (Mixed-linked glucanase AFUA_2G14360) [Durusdinium trenchii]|uniref:3(4)-beta-glucanase AFUA_2G14360 (Mixed-linked glucanase AFUA_2G14360) n=3 Tax=Durusdinium trenchii TaxID=1381693 RepID=A0ABP0JP95_9DINO
MGAAQGNGNGALKWNVDGTMKEYYLPGANIINDGTTVQYGVNNKYYLMNHDTTDYQDASNFEKLQVAGQTLITTIALNGASCGCNVNFFLVNMPAETPGEYGDYYCDANCVGGNCCAEFDLAEMNNQALQITNHNCDPVMRFVPPEFGPGSDTIDTTQPFNYSLTFHQNIYGDGDPNNNLVAYARVWQHDTAVVKSFGGQGSALNSQWQNLADGMVLVVDYWESGSMQWLDGTGCGYGYEEQCGGELADVGNWKLISNDQEDAADCPSQGSCKCDWFNPDTMATADDGSECWCRCGGCKVSPLVPRCSWSGYTPSWATGAAPAGAGAAPAPAPPATTADTATTIACKVGDTVTCPNSTAECAGNQCCPNGDTCPSASSNFTGCSKKRLATCSGSSSTAAPSPAPAPAPLLDCQGESFIDCWNFFTAPDPTEGDVVYVSKDEALELGLYQVNDGVVLLNSTVGQWTPVKSIRLESKERFSEGHLFLIDIKHMPAGLGTWPAWWSYGPDWPNNGEIDTIETVNVENIVQTTLHTSYGCNMDIPGIINPDCNAESGHEGCQVEGPNNSGGAAFNDQGGGVYATQWTSEGIKIWMWPRSQIPQDITAGEPDSLTWGEPYVFFPFGANCPSTHFQDQVLTINTDFCGDWAGEVSPWDSKAECDGFVQDPNNIPKIQGYWQINYVKVFAA